MTFTKEQISLIHKLHGGAKQIEQLLRQMKQNVELARARESMKSAA